MRRLLDGVIKFRRTLLKELVHQFKKVRDNPDPQALFFTCMDSRMITSRIMQAEVGDMFIIRNAGNLVPHARLYPHQVSCEPAAMELACNIFNVRNVVVCGHSDCRAMNLLYRLRDRVNASSTNPNPLEEWVLRHGTSSLEKYASFERNGANKALEFRGETESTIIQAYIDPDNKFVAEDKFSQVNALQQLENVASYPMLRDRLDSGAIRLNAMWFDIYTADVYLFSRKQKRFVRINEETYSQLLLEI